MEPRMQPGEEALEDALDAPLPFDGPPPSIDELVANADAEGLLDLGAAFRAGAGMPRDLFKALECFEAASTLGRADAEYLVGIAHFSGLGVSADEAEGAKRLRSAAQRGSLRAKVYVANLYELGVHYAYDAEKADVWYRNVARAAGIDDEPDTDPHDLAMAELGCVRHCLRLVADESLPKRDRAFYLKKAKAMGYAHRLRQAKRESEASTPAPAPPAAAAEAPVAGESAPEAGAEASEQPAAPATPAEPEKEEEEVLLGAQWTFGAGALALLAAAFFAVASSAAAFLANEGSRTLLLHDRAIPHIGHHHEVIVFAVLVALGVLPAAAVYRPKVVAIGAAAGLAAGAAAHYLHASQPLLWDAPAQAGAAGMAAFLVVVGLLGLLGGTRLRGR